MTQITEKPSTWGRVTEEGLNRLLPRIGKYRQNENSLFGHIPAFSDGRLVVSASYVRRYATGIADRNPLYVDADYAAASIWGRQWAPPPVLAWLEQVNGAVEGFAGCHTIWRNCELEWDRPVFVGDELSATTALTGARLTESRFSGTSAVQDYETAVESGGEPVGRYRTSWHRFSRGEAKDASKYKQSERPQWTDEELAAVADEYRTQNLRRRGAEPLSFEDVEEGSSIPYLIKGPTTLTSKLAFESVNFPGGWVVGHELALDLWDRHPGLAIRNEENVPEPPVAIHWTNERCQRYLGMPAGYEAGYERLHWFTQLLMTWTGDHGFPTRLAVKFLGFHWQGDVVRLFGRVTGKEVSGGRHLVHLDVETKTHRDELTTAGTATVELPSRAAGRGVWPR